MSQDLTGFVVVDKPPAMTSHDVVARMRRLAKTRKVGHGGTLDPMATGVLVLAVGRITRLLTYVTGCDKAYQATIRLGQATVTDDAEGEVTATADTAAVTEADIYAALEPMRGEIEQVPSAVSAIKVNGQRAYKRVRDGEDVQLAARPVTISRLDVTAIARGEDHLDVDVSVDCSSGTYIRAIARDLGAALGVGGHLTALRRTRVGGFTLAEARTLDELSGTDNPITHTTVETVRRLMPIREIEAEETRKLGYGQKLTPSGQPGPYAAVGPGDVVVAVLTEDGRGARPEIVLAPSGG
nr:tRNA pseudouridine(55) synthase TruB [Stackebrandtia nassauensis]